MYPLMIVTIYSIIMRYSAYYNNARIFVAFMAYALQLDFEIFDARKNCSCTRD